MLAILLVTIDVNDDSCSCGLICTSYIDLESEVLALTKMRDYTHVKFEKENELLRSIYA
jgi:hypothetical protein